MKLILTIGIPGSGKTTWRRKFCEKYDFISISPDEIREELGSSMNDFTNEKKVWKEAEIRLTEALSREMNVVFDATNVRAKNRVMPLRVACDFNASIEYAIFPCEKEEAKRRIKKDIETRVNRSNVPDEIVDVMYEQYEKNINEIMTYNHFFVRSSIEDI